MAKSKIIKDLIDRKIDPNQALERLLIIAMEIGDAETIKWVKCEKNGYGENDSVPDYRVLSLTPMGTYQLQGWGYIQTFENRVLPTIGVPDGLKDTYNNHTFRQGISQIIDQYKATQQKEEHIGIPIQPELFYYFEKGTNMHLTSAYFCCSPFDLCKIIDAVRTRIIELLMLLEKNFGNLDELDIEINAYKEKEVKKLQEACAMVIQGNNSGDTYIITNSKIKKSNVGKDNSSDKENNIEISPDVSIQKEKKFPIWKHIIKLFSKKHS